MTHWGPMAPNLLIYICISEVTKQRDNARLRTLVERNQVMQQRRAFGFNSDDAGDDFDDYASTGSSDFPSSRHESEKVKEEIQLSSEEEELDSASTGTRILWAKLEPPCHQTCPQPDTPTEPQNFYQSG